MGTLGTGCSILEGSAALQEGGNRNRFMSVMKFQVSSSVREDTRSILTSARVRTGGVQRNQIHSSVLWTLGIPKMYLGTLGYNVLILH